MDQRTPYILATATITLVWFVDGFFCKVLGLVPRHQEIVGRILGEQHAWLFTKAIGISEILMIVVTLKTYLNLWLAKSRGVKTTVPITGATYFFASLAHSIICLCLLRMILMHTAPHSGKRSFNRKFYFNDPS